VTNRHTARVRLANGWTLSVGEDMPPAIASIAAWPTSDDNKPGQGDSWHEFSRGRLEVRVFDIDDLVEAFESVAALSPPERY
jgi:hypothetical protein